MISCDREKQQCHCVANDINYLVIFHIFFFPENANVFELQNAFVITVNWNRGLCKDLLETMNSKTNIS